MDKTILEQYIDACELVKETEADILRLRKKRREMVQDSVKGSMSDFPYAAKTFHLQGLSAEAVQGDDLLYEEEKLLESRQAAAEAIKRKVEAWMPAQPQRMQRIIRYRLFEEMTWGEVAARIGRKATAEGVKKEFQRFMKKN